MRKICVITGTRAEYGLLSRLMRLIDASSECKLQVIATNMHLLPEYGSTYIEIEKDGFRIDEKVPMKKPSDDGYGVIASMAEEMSGMNDAIHRLSPDMVVVLGDRYEMLVAAIVAMMQHIPIAHLYGGEISEGAVDDSIRHCITKLSSLHFTSTEEYRRRVIQLGEQPDKVFNVGAIGVENIKEIPLMSKEEIEDFLDFSLGKDTVMATYHPVTLGDRTPKEEIDDFLNAMNAFPNLRILFTMPNSDQGGDDIRTAIEKYCQKNPERCKCFVSLGMRKYLSVMQFVGAVIGNSSSGIIEVPSAHIPTLNIGDRQKGRTRGISVYDVPSDTDSIVNGMRHILSPEFKKICLMSVNPYEMSNTTTNIFETISKYPIGSFGQKKFYDL